MVPCLPTEIMTEEESSGGMLNASGHFHHIFHNLLYGRTRYRHVYRANRNHEIEPGDDVACVLDKLV